MLRKRPQRRSRTSVSGTKLRFKLCQHLLRYRVLDNKSENQLQNVFNEMCLTNRARKQAGLSQFASKSACSRARFVGGLLATILILQTDSESRRL